MQIFLHSVHSLARNLTNLSEFTDCVDGANNVNAELSAFTLNHFLWPSVNAEISAFPNLHTAVIYVNAEIPVFKLCQICVNTEISAFLNLNTSVIFVNAEISAFTNILTL